MKDLKVHINALKQAISLLLQGHFVKFLIPGLIVGIFFFTISGGVSLTFKAFSLVEKIPWIGNFLANGIGKAYGGIYSFGFYLYQFIVVTLFSPFMTLLSERVEEHITGKDFPFSLGKFFKDLFRLIDIMLSGMMVYFVFHAIWIITGKIFPIEIINPIISFLIVAFFAGFYSYDYSLERHSISRKASWKYAFANPLQILLTGTVFSVLLLIPYVGVILAPVITTLVSTLIYVRENPATTD